MQRKRRKGGRPKGGGAIKTINAAKEGPFEIRRTLHAGGEQVRGWHAQLFTRWRSLCALRDDCEKRLDAGKGDKWTRKRLKGGTWLKGTRKFKGLYQEIDEV